MAGVSIKGVLLVNRGVVLVRNVERGWELPGGHAEPGETPEQTLKREFQEELSLQVAVRAPVHSYHLELTPGNTVFIVAYGCNLIGDFNPRLSAEHVEYAVCPLDRLPTMPREFRESIERWGYAV